METEDANEQRLIKAAQLDPSRFAELYEAHFDRIYAFAVRRLRDRSTAEDVTAEVFRQALANLARFEWRGVPFAAWLYRIASNAISDHYSWSAREHDALPPAPPRDEIADAERRATLYRLVEALPGDQRTVVTMRFVDERSIREIAAAMGKSEGAIKQLQWRAMQTLRERVRRSNG